MEQQRSTAVVFTDLGLSKELEDREFRNQFFRTEREIDIPAQIKTLRKLRHMRQAELAEKAGTKQSAISRIETSQEAKWELETLVKLAESLDARLSVVIEPYEEVVARYRVREAAVGSSAAAERSDDVSDANEQPQAALAELRATTTTIFGFSLTGSAARWIPSHRAGDYRRQSGQSGLPSMSEGYGISCD